MIQRIDSNNRMSQAVVYNGVVYLAGQVDESASADAPGTVLQQTTNILAQVDGLLTKAGTDKSRLLTATIYLTDIATFGEMNQAWQAWVSPQGLPTRATVEIGALAGPEYKVEIVVTAARRAHGSAVGTGGFCGGGSSGHGHASSSARRFRSAACQMVPLGLCGLLMMRARVRGVNAAAILSKSGRKLPGVSGTRTTVAPVNSMLGT